MSDFILLKWRAQQALNTSLSVGGVGASLMHGCMSGVIIALSPGFTPTNMAGHFFAVTVIQTALTDTRRPYMKAKCASTTSEPFPVKGTTLLCQFLPLGTSSQASLHQ